MVCRGWARPCLRGRPTASCPTPRPRGAGPLYFRVARRYQDGARSNRSLDEHHAVPTYVLGACRSYRPHRPHGRHHGWRKRDRVRRVQHMGRPRGCADCGLERATHRYVPPRCDPEWRLRLCLSAILGHIRSTGYETRSANSRYCVRRHLSIVAALRLSVLSISYQAPSAPTRCSTARRWKCAVWRFTLRSGCRCDSHRRRICYTH